MPTRSNFSDLKPNDTVTLTLTTKIQSVNSNGSIGITDCDNYSVALSGYELDA